MRTRLLSLSLITLLTSSYVGAQVHPKSAELLALPIKDRNFVTAYVNALPVLGYPRVGDSAKETITLVEKLTAFKVGSTKASFAQACTVTVNNDLRIIKVVYPDYYVYSKQTIKMVPAGCGLDDNGDLAFSSEDIFPNGVTSQVSKKTVPAPTDAADIIANWDLWTIAGKNIKFSWSGEAENGYLLSEAGILNLGAANVLCVDNSNFSVKGEELYEEDDIEYRVVFNFLGSYKSVCQAIKPVLGKVNLDIMSVQLNEGTRYCMEDDEDENLNCSSDISTILEDGSAEDLLPILPSLSQVLDA